jgi:hypothetical protein
MDEAELPFSNFLNLEDNNQIIFSGKFGTGKTHFLRNFFFEETRKKKYETIFLYPINYQVSANEDIFELLKYDILRNLIKPSRCLETDLKGDFKCFSNRGPLEKFFTKLPKILGETVSEASLSVPFLDIPLKKPFFLALEECFLTEHGKLEKSQQETEEKYLTYEQGELIELIRRLVKAIKNPVETAETKDSANKKKTVLVIDDFDRIDPEHIFRLLNVFSANLYEESNTISDAIQRIVSSRYGFDHVLLVCDIENIKNVFHHKYGAETDFDGYIDKFYSKAIFEFNNEKAHIEKIESIVNDCFEKNSNLFQFDVQQRIQTDPVLQEDSQKQCTSPLHPNSPKILERTGPRIEQDLKGCLTTMLSIAVRYKKISFRDILRVYNSKLFSKRSYSDYHYSVSISNVQYEFYAPEIMILEFLLIVFGRSKDLIGYLTDLYESSRTKTTWNIEGELESYLYLNDFSLLILFGEELKKITNPSQGSLLEVDTIYPNNRKSNLSVKNNLIAANYKIVLIPYFSGSVNLYKPCIKQEYSSPNVWGLNYLAGAVEVLAQRNLLI